MRALRNALATADSRKFLNFSISGFDGVPENRHLKQLYFNEKKQFKTNQLKTKVFKTNQFKKT